METLIPRFFKAPQVNYFLFGPRGTGKSTYLKMTYPDALWIDLLQPTILQRYVAHPEYLINIVQAYPEKKIIIIDEVQKIPKLLDIVHLLIEQKVDKQFVLCGSSARKLKRSGIDMLAGRALYRTMHPFLLSELNHGYDFNHILNYGLLPVVLNSKNPFDTLQAYVALYLKEEVQLEGLVRNYGNFTRFLESISFSHAGLLNISNVARDCQVERKVVEGYVQILEDILLAYRVPVFSRRSTRRTVAHSKFYLFDCGVFRAIRPKGPLDLPTEIEGAALEGLVAQHLFAWNAYQNSPYQISFWRTYEQQEVDFVLYGSEGFYAIEVKNNPRVRNTDLRNLKAFGREYPESKLILLYRGDERLLLDHILCMPCEEFLRGLVPGKPLLAFWTRGL